MSTSPEERRIASEVARRRTFAIISHPDAGKTTLTEKLLLYGGAIHLAGAVKARRANVLFFGFGQIVPIGLDNVTGCRTQFIGGVL